MSLSPVQTPSENEKTPFATTHKLLTSCTVIDGQTVWLDEIKTYRVFQVLPDGNALAVECDSEYDKYCYGDVALLAKREKPFYDGIKVTIPKPTIEGTYRYETRDNFIKTVPIVR